MDTLHSPQASKTLAAAAGNVYRIIVTNNIKVELKKCG
jgi:hypothetical protein